MDGPLVKFMKKYSSFPYPKLLLDASLTYLTQNAIKKCSCWLEKTFLVYTV